MEYSDGIKDYGRWEAKEARLRMKMKRRRKGRKRKLNESVRQFEISSDQKEISQKPPKTPQDSSLVLSCSLNIWQDLRVSLWNVGVF